jgi:hypothetical protein
VASFCDEVGAFEHLDDRELALGQRPAGGGSVSRTIAAAWLCAISCAKVSETAEQNGQASTCRACPANTPMQIRTAIHGRKHMFLMAAF